VRRTTTDLRAACHAAVLAEAERSGVTGLTVEGVARRASVAKTSIYRHWDSVDDLLIDALGEAHPVEEVTPEGNNLRGDLLAALAQLVAWLASPTATVTASILGERTRRPELVDALYRRVFDHHGRRFTQTVLEHYAALGAIPDFRITPVVCDIGEALVIKHHIDSGELPDAAVLAAIVDQAILPAVGHGPGRDAGE
jgi:AcrR family transcriptional regulator